MNETERVRKLKSQLVSAAVMAEDAEDHLESAAGYAELTPETTEEIWALKLEMNRLSARIRQAIKP